MVEGAVGGGGDGEREAALCGLLDELQVGGVAACPLFGGFWQGVTSTNPGPWALRVVLGCDFWLFVECL